MINRQKRYLSFSGGVAVAAAVMATAPSWVSAESGDARIREILGKPQESDMWGEVILERGGGRDIKVLSISGDTVSVREVVGALHERPARYVVSDFRSVRELGMRRIPLQRAAYVPSKSVTTAMLIELVIPGGGYFYTGENRQGLSLLVFSGAALATAIATGKDAAAGWIPISAWVKVASLLQLRDQVRANNHSREMLALQSGTIFRHVDASVHQLRFAPTAPLAQLTFSF